MGFRSKSAEVWRASGFLQKPQSAIDAGAKDFRPVNGLKPFFKMEPGDRTMWINEDLAPTPPQMRTWTSLTFVALWWGTNYGIGAWSQGSSLVNVGLSFGTALGATAVGEFLLALVAVGCARVGSRYHTGYPVWARSTFGMRGSKFFVGLRGAVAVIWFAVMNFYCAEMLDVALFAVSPNGWGNIPNHLPASSHTTTRVLITYFICWCLHFPFAFVHPSMIKILFELKAIILPISCWGFLAGLIHLAGGRVDFSSLKGTVENNSSAKSWAWMLGINTVFGNFAPMLINQPDLARYSNTPGAAIWPQAISLWVGMMFVTMLGLTSGAATYQIFGEHVWNILTICQLIAENNPTSAWRGGIFVFAITQIYATLGANLFANSIPAAADLASLWPTKINIVRAQVIIFIISWAVQPWSIITNGVKFVTFLGSYTFFCGAMIAILMVDYFIVRRGNIHLPSLFAAKGNTPDKDGLYMIGIGGVNWKAVVAWIAGIAVPLPGLALSYTDKTGSSVTTLKHIYNSGFLISYGISGAIYLLLNFIWKPEIVPEEREAEFVNSFESLGETDGYFPGEQVISFGRETMATSLESALESGQETPENKSNVGVEVVAVHHLR